MWGTQVCEAPNCVREPSLLGTQVCVRRIDSLIDSMGTSVQKTAKGALSQKSYCKIANLFWISSKLEAVGQNLLAEYDITKFNATFL